MSPKFSSRFVLPVALATALVVPAFTARAGDYVTHTYSKSAKGFFDRRGEAYVLCNAKTSTLVNAVLMESGQPVKTVRPDEQLGAVAVTLFGNSDDEFIRPIDTLPQELCAPERTFTFEEVKRLILQARGAHP